MNENILAAAHRLNKSVSFSRVEPFHGASGHCRASMLHLNDIKPTPRGKPRCGPLLKSVKRTRNGVAAMSLPTRQASLEAMLSRASGPGSPDSPQLRRPGPLDSPPVIPIKSSLCRCVSVPVPGWESQARLARLFPAGARCVSSSISPVAIRLGKGRHLYQRSDQTQQCLLLRPVSEAQELAQFNGRKTPTGRSIGLVNDESVTVSRLAPEKPRVAI
jgi:hypothetical protein